MGNSPSRLTVLFVLVAIAALAVVLLTHPRHAHALDLDVHPGASPSLHDALAQARPGDRIFMHAGVHTGSDWLSAQGTATAPITILSADGPRTAVLEGGGGETLRIGDASAYLVIDGLEVRNSADNLIHIDGLSHHITLRNIYAHNAGPDGDVLKVNQCSFITLERSELAFPGHRNITENPCQEDFDFLDVDDAVIRDNFFHDACAMISVLKGGSRRGIIERNVFDGRASTGTDPVVGIGGATDADLFGGENYEVISVIFRSNIIFGGASGAMGVYDASGAYIANNLFINNNRVLVEFRAGNGPAGGSTDVRFASNIFTDTRGQMPPIFVRASHTISALTETNDEFWNSGHALPTSPRLAVATQPGYLLADPLVPLPASLPSYAGAIAGFRPPNSSPAALSGSNTALAPFFVATGVGEQIATLRLGRQDRGPYVLAGTVTSPCTPTTCATQGKNCGSIPDGCGATLACGTCVAPATCGGAGVVNVCGAPPVVPLPVCQLPASTSPQNCSCTCTCQ